MYPTISARTTTAGLALTLAVTVLLASCSSSEAEQSNEGEAPPELALAEESDPQPDALQAVVEITPTDDEANDLEPSGVFELDSLDGQIPACGVDPS